MDRGQDKLSQISADITEIKVMVAKNSVILDQNVNDMKEHIRRTNILEHQMGTALLPIKFAKWSVAIIGAVASFGSIIYASRDVIIHLLQK